MIVFTSAGDNSFIENEFEVVELDKFNKVLDTKFIKRPSARWWIQGLLKRIHNADVRYLSWIKIQKYKFNDES